MMVQAISTSSWNFLLLKSHRSISPVSLIKLHPDNRVAQNFVHRCSTGVQCKAVEVPLPSAKQTEERNNKERRSQFAFENLTSWLLKQEQAGNIDAELTVVLSSISLA